MWWAASVRRGGEGEGKRVYSECSESQSSVEEMRRRRANQAHMASRSIRVEQAVATAAAAVKSWKDVGEQQLSLEQYGVHRAERVHEWGELRGKSERCEWLTGKCESV